MFERLHKFLTMRNFLGGLNVNAMRTQSVTQILQLRHVREEVMDNIIIIVYPQNCTT